MVGDCSWFQWFEPQPGYGRLIMLMTVACDGRDSRLWYFQGAAAVYVALRGTKSRSAMRYLRKSQRLP